MDTILIGLLIPLLGTVLGSAFVFFIHGEPFGSPAEVSAWLCIWRNGGRIGVVTVDSRDRDDER